MSNLPIIISFSIYIAILLGITAYSARRMGKVSVSRFQEEFYVGGRNLGPFIIAIFIAAGAASAGTFLGGPGLTWAWGVGYGWMGLLQVPLNLYILGILAKKIGIIGRRTKATSLLDIIRFRFENFKPLIVILAAVIAVFLTAYATAQIVGGARVLVSLAGVPYIVGLLIYGGIVILYTTLGGFRGAGLAAIVQGIVMSVAVVFVIVAFMQHLGFGGIFHGLEEIDPKLLIAPGVGVPSFFFFSLSIMVGFGLLGLFHAVQGCLAYNTTKTMRQAIAIGVPLLLLWTAGLVVLGGAAGRVFTPTLDVIKSPDLGMLTMVQGVLPPAISGIVLAGVTAAAQSTVAAICILVSASIVVNLYKAYIHVKVSDAGMRKASMIVTALVGLAAFAFATRPPLLLELIIFFAWGGLASALVFPLLLGLYWPRTTKEGALAGVLGGAVSYFLLKQITIPAWPTLAMLPIVVAMAICLALTIGVSLLTPKPPKETLEIYFGKM